MSGYLITPRVYFLEFADYGLFSLVVWQKKDCFSRTILYALHVKRLGCHAQVVLACIEEADVRTVVLGSLVVESGWEEDVVGLPLR